ncbi:hypothetical protein C8R43DRAFT_1179286 [Mycena crocata]|nr:hypothetical protein C8R43DRAFT_1179286 [Mycena crocata]
MESETASTTPEPATSGGQPPTDEIEVSIMDAEPVGGELMGPAGTIQGICKGGPDAPDATDADAEMWGKRTGYDGRGRTGVSETFTKPAGYHCFQHLARHGGTARSASEALGCHHFPPPQARRPPRAITSSVRHQIRVSRLFANCYHRILQPLFDPPFDLVLRLPQTLPVQAPSEKDPTFRKEQHWLGLVFKVTLSHSSASMKQKFRLPSQGVLLRLAVDPRIRRHHRLASNGEEGHKIDAG